ncbi:MAG TPA: radical SAM protein [Ktedonobacteraceae bacterium]
MGRKLLFTVEKQRVLVPVGQPCPFGCRYCYTRGGEVGLAEVSVEEIMTAFTQFARTASFETIQFGYDGDPFARSERGLAMLWQLVSMRKHINFSTKAALSEANFRELAAIHDAMKAMGTTLSALISLSCWESASQVEPHTPTPQERIATLIGLKRLGLSAFIAIRPIVPTIADSEYERIVDAGLRAGCDGFILGPLYADARGLFVRFIQSSVLQATPSRRGTVSWSAHAPTWTRYEDVERLARFIQMIERKGGQSFCSSADAMALLQQEVHVA